MHDSPDGLFDVTAPATRFGVDFGPTARRARSACAGSGRRYHSTPARRRDTDGHTADGAEILRLTLDDAGVVARRSPRAGRAAGTARRRSARAPAWTRHHQRSPGMSAPQCPSRRVGRDAPLPGVLRPCRELHASPSGAAAAPVRLRRPAELRRTSAPGSPHGDRSPPAAALAGLYEVCSRWLEVVPAEPLRPGLVGENLGPGTRRPHNAPDALRAPRHAPSPPLARRLDPGGGPRRRRRGRRRHRLRRPRPRGQGARAMRRADRDPRDLRCRQREPERERQPRPVVVRSTS